MNTPYCICSRCVMDTSDSKITFDDDGVCDHCKGFDINTKPYWHPNDKGREMLDATVKKIKREGSTKELEEELENIRQKVSRRHLRLNVKTKELAKKYNKTSS